MLQQRDIAQLRAFHATHFATQPVPDLMTYPLNAPGQTEPSHDAAIDDDNHDEGSLGYYDDGVKRTLTDSQIKMFRHSEIQRLLSERRVARAKEEAKAKSKECNNSSSNGRESRKRRFEDEPAPSHSHVETLTYDEEPETEKALVTTTKKFLWPVLGQVSK
ncbi:hypothetical protein Z517_02823 [Fonsecaea pedrosoi CBS 271.37]|uniref:Uncharacterized protein n=1 Tax=Fonsecaea pedrosoi CBS 271.37 TaxID=1442368 RepID=A0A0D2GRI6_9EURO|nr:uncharacterized protein Z517_02823 [Fonsecaea pedrosoi CBS 271.37]KIW83578.1 hypothetical protein Z517_02823 [Fonsecaea pedrosoi CBS 271.37]